MDPMEAIRQTFFCECEEQLVELEAGLLALEAGTQDRDTVDAVFRAVHSVKGGAGAFGLDRLVRFAHVFETALDALRAGSLQPDATVVNTLLRAADILADLVRSARDGSAVDAAREAALAAGLAALTAAPGAPPAPPEEADIDLDALAFQPILAAPQPDLARFTVRFRPHAGLYAKANDALLLLRELARLGTCQTQVELDQLPPLDALDPEGAYLTWVCTLATDQPVDAVQEVFEFVDGDCDLSITPAPEPAPEPAIAAPPPPPAPDVDVLALIDRLQAELPGPAQATAPPPRDESASPRPTIRVDLERVDRLIDLVGELVINGAMLSQRVTEAGLSRSSHVAVGLGELEGLTREIQDSVMAIRAQPVKSVFARMPRLVREVAALTGKQVRLISEGEGTEVDKTVIEHLSDPLTHMIRNAIDHGLEKPEARRLAGKPAEGTVRLAALHRSGRIVIEVSDDGAGIDRARVRASAVAKGLIPADAALSDEEIDNLIFLPGFSTAATISDISGRGVGMDVVRRSIVGLGGRIGIASRPGIGSTFTLSLPLTLAVLDGMVVTVADQTLIVPLTNMIETLQPQPADVHPLGDTAWVVAIRGAYIPLISIGGVLGWSDEGWRPGSVALLVEGEDGSRAALLVDAIQGQQQVVIKSLEANYRNVPGVAAATILGNGRVALILDVDGIVADCRPEPAAMRRKELAHV